MNTSYPSMLSMDNEGNSRLYESSYNPYASYSDYPPPSKLEAIDYNYWSSPSNTHNLLTLPPPNSIIEPLSAVSSSNPTIETLVPVSTSQMHSTATTISATHHHHHIHQHLYPSTGPSLSTVTPNVPESSTWFNPGEYPSPTGSYRHYPYANNTFYDQPQWSTPAMKFETPYSPSSSYIESSHFPHPSFSDSKEETSPDCFKHQVAPVPPKNPANGKTRTRDKYRIVYTDHQRYELEHEFSKSKYITIPRKAALSSTLALSERQIKIWFQNRRAKERKLNKKRQESCMRQLNHSTDADSPSEGELESPNYYPNYV